MAKYNQYVEAGKDLEFGREGLIGNVGKLIKIDAPPFYLVAARSSILGTYCGGQVNARAQVLNVYGEPIPGLYAAGEETGGLHSDGHMKGTAFGKALIFGHLAGKFAGIKSFRSTKNYFSAIFLSILLINQRHSQYVGDPIAFYRNFVPEMSLKIHLTEFVGPSLRSAGILIILRPCRYDLSRSLAKTREIDPPRWLA